MRKILVLLASFLLVAFPFNAQAVMQSLNGLTVQSQTFSNDTNLTITSSGTNHALGWSGILQPSRGGTGSDLSTFSSGSIPFWNGSALAESPNLAWDDANSSLVLGSLVLGNANGDPKITAALGFDLVLESSNGVVSGDPGHSILLIAGTSEVDREGGNIEIFSGHGGPTNGDGGNIILTAGGPFNSSSNGGNIVLRPGSATTGNQGKIILRDPAGSGHGVLINTSLLTGDRTVSFQNASGTLPLLLGTSSQTLYVGSEGAPGCIAMGDSDSSGVTYVTANNGVLSASSTKPSNCQ